MHASRTLLFAAATAALAACERMPSGDPAESLSTELRGYEAPVGVMMGVDEKPYWVQAALKGFREVGKGDIPGRLEQRNGISGCLLTRPAAGDKVALVMVDGSPMPAPIYAFSRKLVGDRAETLINVYKQMGKGESPSDAGADQYEAVDVVVTERPAPVHLVLASAANGILFNIQLADGARVSRVAVVGGDNMAVANLDPATPIEFLTGSAKDVCGVAPLRMPADHWQFVRNAHEAGGSLDKLLADNVGHAQRWSAWHRSSFGIDSEPGAIGAESTAAVLVGPMPASPKGRVTYRPLKGAVVLMSPNDHILAGSPADYKKLNDELVRAAATEAAGGDLANLPKEG